MVKPLRYDYRYVNNGIYTGDEIIADNNELIINFYTSWPPRKLNIGDYVTTIPFDKCEICQLDLDLSEYGFIKFNDCWFNTKSSLE